MDSVKPSRAGLNSIRKPHDQTTEYRVEGIKDLYIRVGRKGVLSFQLLIWLPKAQKQKRIKLDIAQDAGKAEMMAAVADAQLHAEVEQDVGDVNLQTVGQQVIDTSDIKPGTKRNYANNLERLVEFMGTRLTGNAGELLAAHKQIGEKYGPVSANNALKFYRRVLNYANAAYGTKIEWPTEKLRVLKIWNTERPREGRAEFKDLPAIWEASNHFPDPWGRILKWYLLTGMRNTEPFKGEVQGDDFVIEDTKNNTTHRVPMTGLMRELYGDGFGVKNGRGITGHLEAGTMGAIHLSPHDLRRTFSAIANHAGVPDYTISMLMNHKKTDITGRYVGRTRDTMELGLLKVEEALEALVRAPVEDDFAGSDIEDRLEKIRHIRERARERREMSQTI